FQQFRLVQKQPDHIEAQYVIEPELNESQSAALVLALQQQLDFPHRITLARQPAISRTPNHKYEDFVSEVAEID
ncbi:MAG: hypothetical protein J4A00_10575, partial [Gammaproteobacteria bacterium]|nr:hypothetical protein [Gammaproteobacteria bacterium]